MCAGRHGRRVVREVRRRQLVAGSASTDQRRCCRVGEHAFECKSVDYQPVVGAGRVEVGLARILQIQRQIPETRDPPVPAQVVVDVTNAPSWEDQAVLEFFESSTRNLLAAEAVAGVGHHVALSVVGSDRLLASGYFRAKVAQEKLIQASPIPHTIVRATQFFEFVRLPVLG